MIILYFDFFNIEYLLLINFDIICLKLIKHTILEISDDYDHYWVDLAGSRIPDEAVVVANYNNNTAYVVQSFLNRYGNQPGLVYRNDTNVSVMFSPEMKLTKGHYTSKVLCSHQVNKLKWIGTTLLGMGRIKCPLVAGGWGTDDGDKTSKRFVGRIIHDKVYYIIPVKEIDDGPDNITVVFTEGSSVAFDKIEVLAFDCFSSEVKDDKLPKLDVFQYFWSDWMPGTVPACAVSVKEQNTTTYFHVGNAFYPGLGLMPVRLEPGSLTAFMPQETKKLVTNETIQVLCSQHNKELSLQRGTMWSTENPDCPRIRIGNNLTAALNFLLIVPQDDVSKRLLQEDILYEREMFQRANLTQNSFMYQILETPVSKTRSSLTSGFNQFSAGAKKYYDFVVDCKKK